MLPIFFFYVANLVRQTVQNLEKILFESFTLKNEFMTQIL